MDLYAPVLQQRRLIPGTEQGLGHVQVVKVDRGSAQRRQRQGKIDGNLALAAAGFSQEHEIMGPLLQKQAGQFGLQTASASFPGSRQRTPCAPAGWMPYGFLMQRFSTSETTARDSSRTKGPT